MPTLVQPVDEAIAETARWAAPPIPKFEEEDLDILALQLWRRASYKEIRPGDDWLSDEEALRLRASCL